MKEVVTQSSEGIAFNPSRTTKNCKGLKEEQAEQLQKQKEGQGGWRAVGMGKNRVLDTDHTRP
jgi:hypothetical protein